MRRRGSYPLGLMYILMTGPSAYASFPSGFMWGAGLGVTSLNTDTTYNSWVATTRNDAHETKDAYGGLGNLALGYGKNVHDKVYLGGELGVNILGGRQTRLGDNSQNNIVVTNDAKTAYLDSVLSTTTRIKENMFVPVLDFKPGLFFGSNTLVFARLGMSYNELELSTSSNYQANGWVANSNNPEMASTAATFYHVKRAQTLGFRRGLGIEYLITKNMSVTANYVYTGYGQMTLHGAQTSNQIACDTYEGCSVDKTGRYTTQSKSKIAVQDVMVQLIYHLA